MSLQALQEDLTIDPGSDFDDDEIVQVMEDFAEAGDRAAITSSDPGFIPSPLDIEISEQEMEDALNLVQNVKDFGELAFKKGESRSYTFNEKSGDSIEEKEIFVCDISDQAMQEEWATDYAQAVGSGLKKRLKLMWANVVNSFSSRKQAMVIAGRAKDVGVAKEKFYAAMAMAGLGIQNGQYQKTKNAQDLFVTRLQDHGFECKNIADCGDLDLSFEAINDIPEKFHADAIRVVLNNLVEDFQVLSKLRNDVVKEYRQRPNYQKIKLILDKYDIQEESLYHILIRSISKQKIDPDGQITEMLVANHNLTSELDFELGTYKQAVQKLFEVGQQFGVSYSDLQSTLTERQNPQLIEALEIPVMATADVAEQSGPAAPQGPAGPAGPAVGPIQ